MRIGFFDYIWQAVQSTFSQLVILLGPGLALALVMHLLSGYIAAKACRVIGRSAFLLLFGWLGTIVHEGGHALFCLLFGHRITAIKWFDFSCRDGSLGYVKHSYDRNSIYQSIGLFFIGIGPILLGTAILWYASKYLLGAAAFTALRHNVDPAALFAGHSLAGLAKAVGHSFLTIMTTVFSAGNLASWKFYLFLYLAFSVGSSITLSPADFQGAASGFFTLAGGLLLFNLAANWLGGMPQSLFLGLSQSYSLLYLAMLFAILVNAMVAALLLLFPAPRR